MFMLQSVAVVVAIALVAGQTDYDLPTATRLSDQEQKLLVQYNTTYYVAAAEKPTIPQLFISDEEAKELCSPLARDHPSISTKHPRTCSGRVLCLRTKRNQFEVNTVYRITAIVFATAQGTFWDHEYKTMRTRSSSNNCDSDPCKTGKDITDGRHCYTYLTCVTAGDSSSYEERECADGESFDVNAGTCVPDDTCTKALTKRYTNLYCNASVPAVKIPGVKDGAYFNRTFRDEDDGSVTTVPEYCTASMVFDNSNPTECKCILESEARCPKTLVQLDSEVAGKTWNDAPQQDGYFTVESGNQQYNGWAALDGASMSFYMAGALANNELAGNFTLSFRFALNQQSSGAVSLVSNSLNAGTCPTATLSVYLDQQRAVVAEVINVNDVVATATSTPINAGGAVSVELRRDGGQLILNVNGQDFSATQTLGTQRLKATNCGLVLGKSSTRPSLNGWIDKVLLISRCQNSA